MGSDKVRDSEAAPCSSLCPMTKDEIPEMTNPNCRYGYPHESFSS